MRKQIVQDILGAFKQRSLDFDVYIMANVQGKTIDLDGGIINHANEDEFFSRAEFAEIASSIFDVFGFVRVFFSESELMAYLQNNNIKPTDCIIYNFARDGIAEGKKALVPAFCDFYGYKYTGSNAFVLSLLRNKYVYSKYLGAHNIEVPRTWLFNKETGFFGESRPELGQKIIVKYISESASMGINKKNVLNYEDDFLVEQIRKRMGNDKVLVQEYIDGPECEVLVLKTPEGYRALDPIQIVFADGVKYMTSDMSNNYDYEFELLENTLKGEICERICKTAEQSAQLLGVSTYARFDFKINDNDTPNLFDIAGTPYTTRHSSPAYLFSDVYGFEFKDIFKTIVELTLESLSI
jgi:D-alanine-D-alanine ligase